MTAAAVAPDLARGFEAFVEAAQRLERRYAELVVRADAVDLQLARTNAELQATLADREAVLSALPVGVIALDEAGAVTWTNREGGRLVGATAAAGAIADLAEGECRHGGLLLAVRRVPLHAGGTLLVVEDRTAIDQLTREVDRLDRLAGLTELSLGVAHEIKNPLNGVLGFAALLERTDDVAALRRYADHIAGGLRQVDAIVTEMLAFARSPGAGVARAPLAEVVAEAARAAGLPRTAVECDGDCRARVDCTALVRVLANLLRNSAEAAATPVRMHARRQQRTLVIDVSDTGPGITPAVAERLFEPGVSTKERGSGLGLALAARVMGYLGGSIELLEGGPGARFRVTVPADAVDRETHD